MNIQYASDLHLEFSHNRDFLKANPIKPKGDILLLSGDIVLFSVMHKHADFFNYLSDSFQATYWIPGNHEYYNSDISKRSGTFCEKIRDNVFLINNTSVIHEDVKFIFSTLWSNIRPAYVWQIERGLSDFHVIKYFGKRFSAPQFNQLHEDSLNFIKQELASKQAYKTVIATHHVPTLMNYPEKYKGDVLNDAFATELFDLIEATKPDYWIYGHTHSNTQDFKIGETQLLTNQLGYVHHNEHALFNNEKMIIL